MRNREGDHVGRFSLPDGRQAHGTLRLESNRPPSASMRPERSSSIGPEGKGFPQESPIDQLVGELHSNEEAILGDVHLTEWISDHFLVSARWALIGLSLTKVPHAGWSSCRVHATGLEAIIGNAIAVTNFPGERSSGPLKYMAELNPDAEFVSEEAGVTVAARYETQATVFDPYSFKVSNLAIVSLTSITPLTVDDWVNGWIEPLRGLLTLATGEPEKLQTVTVSGSRPKGNWRSSSAHQHNVTGHLFGAGIHQLEQPAERRSRPDGTPLIPLFTLNAAPPLATLVQTWRTSLADETATSLYRLALGRSLPAPVRFLLFAQALESLETNSRASSEQAEDARHAARLTAALSAIADVPDKHLDHGTKRFIRDSLAKRPFRSLAARLHRLLQRVPRHQERLAVWTAQTEILATELEISGRNSSTLHERLGSARNALSHGAELSAAALDPAITILEILLRAQLLERLGFDAEQLATAYDRMTNVA